MTRIYSALIVALLLLLLLLLPSSASAQGSGRYGDITLRQGTNVWVRFPDNLDSDRNRNGDQFQAVLDQDLVSNNGRVAARAGSIVFLRFVDVQAGASRNRSRVSLMVTSIQVDSSVIPVETNTITVETAPARNQKLNFRLARSITVDSRGDQSGTAGRREPGRTDVIARELDRRAQRLFETVRNIRGTTDSRTFNGRSDLYSAVGRFANDTQSFSQNRDFTNGASRQAAGSLVSQAEQISRLTARTDGAFRYQNEWRMVEDQVVLLSENFGLRYTPSRELARDDNQQGRDRGYGSDRSAAGSGSFHWRGRVDGSDYIELRGDQVNVRHVAALPITEATYDVRRPLPRQALTVQLNKLHGRGKVVLTQQPSSANNYTAIVFIEDNEGSSDLYEFELTW